MDQVFVPNEDLTSLWTIDQTLVALGFDKITDRLVEHDIMGIVFVHDLLQA